VAAECEQPDLILFDVKTPIVNGLTTLIMLRQNPRTVAIPVILMTANLQTWAAWHADELTHRRFQKLDIIGFIEKSFDRITLPAQIRRLAAARQRLTSGDTVF
jgi:CheY-like chemotaxis protein